MFGPGPLRGITSGISISRTRRRRQSGAAAALDRVGKPLKPPARAQPDPLGQDSSKVEQMTELTGQEQQIPKPWQISGSLSHSENTANRAAGVRDGRQSGLGHGLCRALPPREGRNGAVHHLWPNQNGMPILILPRRACCRARCFNRAAASPPRAPRIEAGPDCRSDAGRCSGT